MQPQRSGPVARCLCPSTAGRFPACISQRGYSAWRKSCTVLPEHLHPQLVVRLTVHKREITSRAGQVPSWDSSSNSADEAGLAYLPHASCRRSRYTSLPAVLPPLMNGASENRSECDQIKSPDFRVSVPDTIQALVPSNSLSRAVSVPNSKTASASFGLVANEKHDLPLSASFRISSPPFSAA